MAFVRTSSLDNTQKRDRLKFQFEELNRGPSIAAPRDRSLGLVLHARLIARPMPSADLAMDMTPNCATVLSRTHNISLLITC